MIRGIFLMVFQVLPQTMGSWYDCQVQTMFSDFTPTTTWSPGSRCAEQGPQAAGSHRGPLRTAWTFGPFPAPARG